MTRLTEDQCLHGLVDGANIRTLPLSVLLLVMLLWSSSVSDLLSCPASRLSLLCVCGGQRSSASVCLSVCLTVCLTRPFINPLAICVTYTHTHTQIQRQQQQQKQQLVTTTTMALSFAFRQQRRLVASTTSFSSPWGFSSMRSALDGLVTLPVSRIVRQELQHHPLFQVRFKSMLKTNKSAAKRFRIRGNGSIKRYVTFWKDEYGKK